MISEGGRENPEALKTAGDDSRSLYLAFLENKEMYRLPGDTELSDKDIKRYTSKAARDFSASKEEIEKGLEDENSFVAKDAASAISLAPEAARAALIERALKSENAFACANAIACVDKAPLAERAKLVERGMLNDHTFVKVESVKMIPSLPESERFRLIELCINDESIDVAVNALAVTSCLSERDRTIIFVKAMKSKMKRVRQETLSRIFIIPEHLRAGIVELGVEDENNDIVKNAFRLIPYISVDEQVRIINCILDDKSDVTRVLFCSEMKHYIDRVPAEVRFRIVETGIGLHVINTVDAVNSARYLVREEKNILFKRLSSAGLMSDFLRMHAEIELMEESDLVVYTLNALQDENERVRNVAADMIKRIPASQRVAVIEVALDSRDIIILFCAIKSAGDLSPEETAQIIAKAMLNDNAAVRAEAVRLIPKAPVFERERLTEIGFSDNDFVVRQEAVKTVSAMPEGVRAGIIGRHKQVFEQMEEAASFSPLYRDKQERFFRSHFNKTGSDTTLLDRVPAMNETSLRHRLIVRHIRSSSYYAWKHAYEAAEFWKGKGFDYVPVEPIVSVSKDKNPFTVKVFTRVLNGPSIDSFRDAGGMYGDEINAAANKIINGLEELGIKHGHTHTGNFVVVFERDESGRVMLERVPRLYVIDFDQAVSPAK